MLKGFQDVLISESPCVGGGNDYLGIVFLALPREQPMVMDW